MDFTKSDFLDHCGLKYNKSVILDQEAVFAFYQEHVSWFQDTTISLEKDGTTYGTCSNGDLYKIGIKHHKIERLVIETRAKDSKRVKMTIIYDGTDFSGFQVQTKDRSVQGEIERIVSEIHNAPTKIVGASRTDAGVHALAQVIHFDTVRDDSIDRWTYFFNKRLPKDIHVLSAEFVHPLFHARYDVLKKEYRYRINTQGYHPLERNYEWFVGEINTLRLKKELKSIEGTHDFNSFAKGEKDSFVRTIFEARLEEHSTYAEIVFVGDGFLRYMIRLMVYTLIKISKSEIEVSMKELIEEKSRIHTIHLAPAGGLYLSKIDYQ